MDDTQRLEGLLKGRPEAFQALYEAHKEEVGRTCAYLVGDEREAVGVVASTFLAARDQIKDKGLPALSMEPWLESLAVRQCFAVLRQAKADFETQTQQLESLANRIPVLLEISPDSRERVNFMVRAELDDIPEPHHQILAMSELEGLNVLEMAKRLQCAWLTALKRLYQAREVLAERAKAKVKD